MLRLRSPLLAATFAAALCATPALSIAAAVSGQYSLLAGNTWSLSLAVNNDGSLAAIPGFSVYFDRDLFTNLANPMAPATWEPLLLQPIANVADGLFDAYVFDDSDALTPGQSLGGFSLTFNYLGSGDPGALPFELYRIDNSGNFVPLGDGTVATRVAVVPVPGSLWLAGLGLAALPLLRQHRRLVRKEIA
jgi:hypothetical protein